MIWGVKNPYFWFNTHMEIRMFCSSSSGRDRQKCFANDNAVVLPENLGRAEHHWEVLSLFSCLLSSKEQQPFRLSM